MTNNKVTLKVVFEVPSEQNNEAHFWHLILADMLRDANEIKNGWDEVIYEVTKKGEVRRLSSWMPACK